MVVVIRGRYAATTAGRRLSLAPGGAVLYPAGCDHQPQRSGNRSLTIVCISWHDDHDYGQTAVGMPDPTQRLAMSALWLYELSLDSASTAPRAALLEAMLDRLIRLQSNHDADDPVERLRHLIANNLDIDQHMPNLAAAVGLSPVHLTRLFVARHGITPMRYLRQLRIQAALAMIRNRQGDLTSIATACGFTRPSYLARVIHDSTGRSVRQIMNEQVSGPSDEQLIDPTTAPWQPRRTNPD